MNSLSCFATRSAGRRGRGQGDEKVKGAGEEAGPGSLVTPWRTTMELSMHAESREGGATRTSSFAQ
jgi:hypothetical protein